MNNWFEINKEGLAKILARKGKEFALFELIQNAWDEPGVTTVEVKLFQDAAPGYAYLIVSDDAPNGFADLAHAYTLFAESNKKTNPEQRGRFNLGEKLVLALAREAQISTTTGTVNFNKSGRRRSSARRDAGSQIEMSLRMNKVEIETALLACRRLIPPTGTKTIVTTINGRVLGSAPGFASFDASLPTEIADNEGNLVRATRKTTVRVYKAWPENGCPAAIYEMGIPVCEIEGKYIFDVGQKVPLTMDREEVLPAFRKQLSVYALNHLADKIDGEDATSAWVTDAMSSPDATPEALKSCLTQRFGVKRVIYDPSDVEANNRAAAAGYTVVTGGQLNGPTWQNVKRIGAILPAGQVTPSPKPYGENGTPVILIKEKTAGMEEVEAYAKKFARVVLDCDISVRFANDVTWPFAATYGPGDLTFNVGRLGKAWFNLKTNQTRIDNLIIHEFGHHYSLNHLSEEYYDALTSIGARLAQVIRAGEL